MKTDQEIQDYLFGMKVSNHLTQLQALCAKHKAMLCINRSGVTLSRDNSGRSEFVNTVAEVIDILRGNK